LRLHFAIALEIEAGSPLLIFGMRQNQSQKIECSDRFDVHLGKLL